MRVDRPSAIDHTGVNPPPARGRGGAGAAQTGQGGVEEAPGESVENEHEGGVLA